MNLNEKMGTRWKGIRKCVFKSPQNFFTRIKELRLETCTLTHVKTQMRD